MGIRRHFLAERRGPQINQKLFPKFGSGLSTFKNYCRRKRQSRIPAKEGLYPSLFATMGSSDNFCLRWNDFESNISTSFRELREDSEFLDVTLCCDNGVDVVQAHKVILAACSPLFRKILSRQKSTGQNPFLYLKGIRLKELRAVLDFIYHGEVNVAQDSLNNFLAVAEELAIKGLTTDSQKPGGSDPHANSEQRKKAVAKRKSVPQSSSAPVQIPVQAKKPKTDDDVEGIIEDVDVKGIKAEPEPSGSGVSAPNVNPMVEAELDDSYHGGGADDDNGDFGGGEEFEGFDQYGDGNEFDDSLGAAGASASAGADGKDLTHLIGFENGKSICTACGYKSDYQYSVKRHIEAKHMQLSYPCNYCSKVCN